MIIIPKKIKSSPIINITTFGIVQCKDYWQLSMDQVPFMQFDLKYTRKECVRELIKWLDSFYDLSYLACKNEIRWTTIVWADKKVRLKLPICDYCKNPISGFRYFQSTVDSPRLHLKCFFKSVEARLDYKRNFFSDQYLIGLTNERELRWNNYVINASRISKE